MDMFDTIYQCGPYTHVYDVTSEEMLTAFLIRHKEYTENNYGDLVYGEDPLLVTPELIYMKDKDGNEKLASNMDEVDGDDTIISFLWSSGLNQHIFCCPYSGVKPLH